MIRIVFMCVCVCIDTHMHIDVSDARGVELCKLAESQSICTCVPFHGWRTCTTLALDSIPCATYAYQEGDDSRKAAQGRYLRRWWHSCRIEQKWRCYGGMIRRTALVVARSWCSQQDQTGARSGRQSPKLSTRSVDVGP